MEKRLLITNLIIGGIMLVSLIVACFTGFNFVGSTYDTSIEALDGWYYLDSDGNLTSKPANLSELEFDKNNHASVGRIISSDGLEGGDLCFISTNADFDLYLNDEKIYDFNPELKVYAGKAYGNYVHEINSPYFTGDAMMRLEVTSVDGAMWSGFDRAYFQGTAGYLKDILSDNLYKLVLSLICFIIGVMLVLLALIFETGSHNRLETVSVGVVAMILSFWTNSGTFMLEMLVPDVGLIRMLNYVALIFLPLPGLLIVCCVTYNQKSRLIRVLEILMLLNIIVNVVAIGSGKYDYHDVLYFTHFNFLLAVVFSLYLIGRAFRRHVMKKRGQFIVLYSFMFLVLTGIVDLVLYYATDSTDMARFSRVGLLIFVVVLSIHEIGQLIELGQIVHESDLMNRLAHEDGLTKLENRLAFNEYETELSMRPEGHCIIVQFDINFLKKVNDNYGHTEGDRIIIGGANAIRDSFSETGRVFRTGGDEFIAVLEGRNSEKLIAEYEQYEKKLQENIDEFNEQDDLPVKLSIAYGMAEFDCSTGNPEEQERLADERMYKHKKAMKEMAATR